MGKTIIRISTPESLNFMWDVLADSYFQKREFLAHLHRYNPCSQRYYELYNEGILIAGTVVYTYTVNILTFANIHSPYKFNIIGLPVSVATPPVIGDSSEFDYFLERLVQLESGLILGINFMQDHLINKALNFRALPTFMLNLNSESMPEYEESLRYGYRRRLHLIRGKFKGIETRVTDCSAFTLEHYKLYLQIMKRTTTKIEVLPFEVFKYLPANFSLTTYYHANKMLCWTVICEDDKLLTYFFGGMNYSSRDTYSSYNNSLLGIIQAAFQMKYKTIDLGQTAEVAKSRLGGVKSERRMFVYHKNHAVMVLLKLCSGLINYSKVTVDHKVFKSSSRFTVKSPA